MNLYRNLGDRVGTLEARELAEQLMAWHDAMVKHVRVAGARRGDACGDGCPHDEAATLWSAALDVFGADASQLVFLRTHGSRMPPPSRGVAARIRA